MSDFKVSNYAPSFYIGDTTQGISSAVFHDPNFSSFNNRSSVSMITGAPGSGKTFLAMTLCAQAAVAGKMTVVIDPKADFIALKNLEGDLGKVRVLELSEDSRQGIIDPFVICGEDKTEGVILAKEIIKIFTNITDLPFEVIDPILEDVSVQDNANLNSVVDKLLGFDRENNPVQSERVRNIGMMLRTISKMPLARLAFANPYNVPERVSLKEGLTILTMLDLRLPEADQPKEEYSEPNRLSSGLMFLVTDYVHKVMKAKTEGLPKVLIIDEAWAVLQNQAGASVVRSVSRMGRSLNMAMVLITQNAGHVSGFGIENTITTYFAFSTNGQEGNRITEMMGLRDPEEDEPRDFSRMMSDLNNGECLMRDWRQRYATVQISSYKKDWATAFKTNPLDKARAAAEKKEREKKERSERKKVSAR